MMPSPQAVRILIHLALITATTVAAGCAAGNKTARSGDVAAPDARAVASAVPDNPAIDMPGFLESADSAADHRELRRLSEAEFIRMSREPGTVVLDARSADKYAELHVAGAINLSFPDITVASLAETIPDKNTRILIYCNNNFVNSESAFPMKMAQVALNLSTYVTLYTYGYRNVYELGPQLDPATATLELVSSLSVNEASTAEAAQATQ